MWKCTVHLHQSHLCTTWVAEVGEGIIAVALHPPLAMPLAHLLPVRCGAVHPPPGGNRVALVFLC